MSTSARYFNADSWLFHIASRIRPYSVSILSVSAQLRLVSLHHRPTIPLQVWLPIAAHRQQTLRDRQAIRAVRWVKTILRLWAQAIRGVPPFLFPDGDK